MMIEVMSALTCQLAGVDPTNPKQTCLGIDSLTGKIGFLPQSSTPNGGGGAIGFMGNMISVLYTPPLHTGDYFQNLASNFGLSKKTYAQTTGTGFQSLSPLIGIWSAFRNIVYLFLVIVFVVIGLAIMLRVKIDPRTVMTIQNQIPKIIIGILAVTFSFAIAGFLIDMMWVFIYLIYGIISGISPEIAKGVAGLNPAAIQGQTAMGAAGKIADGGIFGIASSVAGSAGNIIANMLGFSSLAISSGATAVIGALVGTFIMPAIGTFVGALLGAAAPSFALALSILIILLIVLIALLVALFRLWFTLLMAYVQILLAVVLAPFWIIGGIVPGSPISLTGWLKDIGANLLAFPVTIAMFMLGKVFMDIFGTTPAGQSFVPPLIGNPGDPSLIGSLIGLGILLMTPNVVNLLKQMLKVPKVETGIGAALGAGAAIPMGTGKNVAGLITAYKYDITGQRKTDFGFGRVLQHLFR